MPKCTVKGCNVTWLGATVKQPDRTWKECHEDMPCAWHEAEQAVEPDDKYVQTYDTIRSIEY